MSSEGIVYKKKREYPLKYDRVIEIKHILSERRIVLCYIDIGM